jgi:hypothetical protein
MNDMNDMYDVNNPESLMGHAPDLRSRESGVYALRNMSGHDADVMTECLTGRLGKPYIQSKSHVPGLYVQHEFDEKRLWVTLGRWSGVKGMRMFGYISSDAAFLDELTGWGDPAEGKYHLTLHMRHAPDKEPKEKGKKKR